MTSKFQALPWTIVAGHVGVGMASASFWRGAWYMLDDCLYPGDPFKSATASFALGVTGMLGSQGMISRTERIRPGTLQQVAKFGALYVIAMSCVLVWRGTWVMWDVVYEKAHHCPIQKTGPRATDERHATYSGLASHLTAIVGLISCGLFASVFAPPAGIAVISNAAVKAPRQYANRAAAGSVQHVVNRLWSSSLSKAQQHIQSTSASMLMHPQRAWHSSAPPPLRHISPLNDRVLASPRLNIGRRSYLSPQTRERRTIWNAA